MLNLDDIANLATAIVLVMAAVFLLLITLRMKTNESSLKTGMARIRIATALLGAFLLSHGLYHLSILASAPTMDDNSLYPISVGLLVIFAVYVRYRIFVPAPPSKTSIIQEKVKKNPPPAFLRRNLPIIVGCCAAFALGIYASIVYDNPTDVFDLAGIVGSAILFAWMLYKNDSTDTWHFGFAAITIVWAAAEIPYDLSDMGIITVQPIDTFGAWIHFLSMALIGVFVSYRAAKITFSGSPARPEIAVEMKH